MLGLPYVWPKHFPPELREVKQEVLNEEMERVPAASIAIIQTRVVKADFLKAVREAVA